MKPHQAKSPYDPIQATAFFPADSQERFQSN
ncbi:hypothetical protein D039_5123, partial [Vibrio parahaemolyticus EKP-028]